jgi:hypothetical protein
MENKNIYSAPDSRLVDDVAITIGYSKWQRCYITFMWAIPFYLSFILLGTSKNAWLVGAIGAVVFAFISAVVALVIPAKRKFVFVSVSLLLGLTGAVLFGFE